MNLKNPSLFKIFEILEKNLGSIRVSDNIQSQFSQIKSHFLESAIEPEYFFSQIRINENYDGLATDSIFFDEKKVYDLVVGKHNLSLIETPWSDFTTVRIRAIPNITTKNENNQTTKEVTGQRIRLELQGKNQLSLYYEDSDKEFENMFDLFKALKKYL